MTDNDSSKTFSYHDVKLFRKESLGSGSYGFVCKAKCDQLTCAAKIMHQALFQFGSASDTLLTKFKQECTLLSAAKHPNIVQYIHTYQDPQSGLPVLLMELCDESLTKFLEQSERPLPYYLEVDISTDIAVALCYLHANGVIHRDLTSNNVLLNGGCRAKVTDFGMSKLTNVSPRLTPMTTCPGNRLYMAPEALQQPPHYTSMLDCFSWGVLAIQIMTRLFPDPGPPHNTVHQPNGRIVHEVIPEDERRKSHIDLVDPEHPVLPLAIKCLSYSEKERYSALVLSDSLSQLKQEERYIQSEESSKKCTSTQPQDLVSREELDEALENVTILSKELSGKDSELSKAIVMITKLESELESSKRETSHLKQTVTQRDDTIYDLQRSLEQQQHMIKDLSSNINGSQYQNFKPLPRNSPIPQNSPPVPPRSRLSLDPTDSPSGTHNKPSSPTTCPGGSPKRYHHSPILQHSAVIQNTGSSSSSHPEDSASPYLVPLKTTPPRQAGPPVSRETRPPVPREPVPQIPREDVLREAERRAFHATQQRVIKFTLQKAENAPEKMSRGTAFVYNNTAYFAGFSSNKIYAYQYLMGSGKWTCLPKSPYVCFSLAVINGFVSTIGGCKSLGSDPNNTVLSLISEGYKKKWLEVNPPMPTPRQETAVVSTYHYLVVIGGRGKGGGRLGTVEVLNLERKLWQVAGSLPICLTRPTATLCDNEIYLGAGSPFQGAASKAVYKASLSKLLSPYHTFPSGEGGRQMQNAWMEIASVDTDNYTLCSVGGRLLAMGGMEMSFSSSNSIRQYDAERNRWEVVGHTRHGHCLPLVASLPKDVMVVVGGMSPNGDINTVEVTAVGYSLEGGCLLARII